MSAGFIRTSLVPEARHYLSTAASDLDLLQKAK